MNGLVKAVIAGGVGAYVGEKYIKSHVVSAIGAGDANKLALASALSSGLGTAGAWWILAKVG